MGLIEAEACAAHHARDESFGSHGYRWARRVLDLAEETGSRTVLDYGCGKGTLARRLKEMKAPLEVREHDPGVPGKEAPPDPAHLVVCTDVLNFVPEAELPGVLGHIAGLAGRAVLLTIPIHEPERVRPNRGPVPCHIWQPERWLPLLRAVWPSYRLEDNGPSSGRTRYLVLTSHAGLRPF